MPGTSSTSFHQLYRDPILLSGTISRSEFFKYAGGYIYELVERCFKSGQKKFPSSSPCTWMSLLNITMKEEKNQIMFALLFCVFIPESMPKDAYAVSDWKEFQYPIRYYVGATLKQIG